VASDQEDGSRRRQRAAEDERSHQRRAAAVCAAGRLDGGEGARQGAKEEVKGGDQLTRSAKHCPPARGLAAAARCRPGWAERLCREGVVRPWDLAVDIQHVLGERLEQRARRSRRRRFGEGHGRVEAQQLLRCARRHIYISRKYLIFHAV